MRLNRKHLKENKEQAIKRAKDKMLMRTQQEESKEKTCENCKDWHSFKRTDEIGLCVKDRLKSFFFFSCEGFTERIIFQFSEGMAEKVNNKIVIQEQTGKPVT